MTTVLFGIFSPTEAGTVTVVYTALIGLFYYRTLTFERFSASIMATAKVTAGSLLIVAMAVLFGRIATFHQVPQALLNLPFHLAIDDAMFFNFAWLNSENDAQRMMDPDHVEEIWWAAFLQHYQQGGYYKICMHPFVSGRALRIAMLDRLIERMKRLPGVWFPTCEEVARHVLAAHPAH